MRVKNIQSLLGQDAFGACHGFLIYGNLEGATQFHFDIITRHAKTLGFKIENVASLSDVDTGAEPSLFGDTSAKKLTIVRGITGRDFESIRQALNAAGPDHIMVFVGGNLGSKIKLVQHFQTEKTLGAIACYDLSTDLVRSVLVTALTQHSIPLTDAQMNVLVETYAGSPVSLFTDIDKIALYSHGDDKIDTPDLLTLVNGAARLDVDLILSGFLRRQKEMLLTHATTEFLEADPYLILRSLSRQLQQFCEFMAHLKVTNNASAALQKMSVPVFFQTKSLFQEASSLWTEKLAALALRHSLDLEVKFKRGDLSLQQFQAGLCLFAR